MLVLGMGLLSCEQSPPKESANTDNYVRTWFCIGNSSKKEKIDSVVISVDNKEFNLTDIETETSKDLYIYHKKNSEVNFKIKFTGNNGNTYTKTFKPSEAARDWYSFTINEKGKITGMR
jgi:hypothetical protein